MEKNTAIFLALAALVILGGGVAGCTHHRVNRFQSLLDPMVGKAKKAEVAKVLGAPVNCKPESVTERCEYRTAREHNDPVPIVHTKQPGFGPDVSPYDYFDTLYCTYDSLGTLKEWEPGVVKD